MYQGEIIIQQILRFIFLCIAFNYQGSFFLSLMPTLESGFKDCALARPKVKSIVYSVAFKVVRPVYIKRKGASEKHCPLP